MIDAREAIKLAKEYNDKYNAVQEYADAYEFFIDDGVIRDGGGDCSTIIEKSSGKILRWSEYFMDSSRAIVEIGGVKHLDEI